ncbi:hypothetical protein RND61_21410 [Streptomyces sp. TRM76323]|uniref:Uncharacterized protein n=1 Tax=Streptomyces tamarix TaxID=3078565 RepID=A0ABU3QPA8_9ACTN|nr:hypothetical protein [Streptomyces tamarix]MDT9684595.1 hypothetical protein [Streptomyces tamarix]
MGVSDIFAEKRVTRVAEVVNEDDEIVGLQVTTASGERFVLTDWTDWTLRVDTRGDDELPDYFWPPEEHSLNTVFESRDGAVVTSVREHVDEMGDVIGLHLSIESFGDFSVHADAEGFSWKRGAGV